MVDGAVTILTDRRIVISGAESEKRESVLRYEIITRVYISGRTLLIYTYITYIRY